MKELSVFVDESGDWGEYDYHSPFYIITFVFHNQDSSIATDLLKIETELKNIGFDGYCLHAGPIIRGEDEYRNIDISNRKSVFRKMMGFVRRMNIKYRSFYIEKKQFSDSLEAIGRLSKQLSLFIRNHYDIFLSYDKIKVYYDNGQIEVNKILSSVFNVLLDNVEFKKVLPKEYRLFQVADFLCTITLLELKLEHKSLSKSELFFFDSERTLRKKYIKALNSKLIN